MPKKFLLICLLLFLGIALFTGNNSIELRAEEPRRAIVSIEMVLSGNYLVPHINGWSYYNKPPLFNWVMAAFFRLFDSFDEWVVRLPSVVSLVFSGFLIFFGCRRYIGKAEALLAAFFYVTSVDIFFYATYNAGEIDLFYSLLTFCQVMAIFLFHQRGNWLALYVVSYFFAAAGFLTKGLPSIAFQGITLLAYLLFQKQGKRLFHPTHFVGILTFLLITGGYFYLYSQQDDVVGFLTTQYKEASQRTGLESNGLALIKGSLEFPFLLMRLLLPWSLCCFFLFNRSFVQLLRSNALLIFCVVFVLANIPIYWFSGGIKNRYLYPFFPFVAIILAKGFVLMQHHYPVIRRWLFRFFHFCLGIFCLGSAVLMLLPVTRSLPYIPYLAFFGILAGSVLLYGYDKWKEQRIWIFLLMLVFARLIANFVYPPLVVLDKSADSYRIQVEQLFELSGGQPIFWAGKPYTFQREASLGPVFFKEVTLTTAPLLAYQIPYYITKTSGRVMQYDPIMKAGRFYLGIYDDLNPKKVLVLRELKDKWTSRTLVLCRLK